MRGVTPPPPPRPHTPGEGPRDQEEGEAAFAVKIIWPWAVAVSDPAHMFDIEGHSSVVKYSRPSLLCGVDIVLYFLSVPCTFSARFSSNANFVIIIWPLVASNRLRVFSVSIK